MLPPFPQTKWTTIERPSRSYRFGVPHVPKAIGVGIHPRDVDDWRQRLGHPGAINDLTLARTSVVEEQVANLDHVASTDAEIALSDTFPPRAAPP